MYQSCTDTLPAREDPAERGIAPGGRKDEIALAALRDSLDRFARRADVLHTVVVALGVAGDTESAKDVAKLLKKAVGKDPRLASAAIGALGKMPSKDSIDALVGHLAAVSRPRGASHPELVGELLPAPAR